MTDRPVAIVTAASQGLGAAIARRLARDGFTLSLMARSEGVLALADELGGHGMRGSVAELGDLQRLVADTIDRYGRIDALVCNTGATAKGEILAIPDQDWHEGFDLALLHAIRLARLVTPAMTAQGGGAIVNISSFAAREPSGRFPVSSVLRAGLSAFVKLFVEEHGPAGIRMNNLLPGYIDNWPQPPDRAATIPARRAGRPEEIAGTVSFLVSADGAYVTGQDILVDGGLVRGI